MNKLPKKELGEAMKSEETNKKIWLGILALGIGGALFELMVNDQSGAVELVFNTAAYIGLAIFGAGFGYVAVDLWKMRTNRKRLS